MKISKNITSPYLTAVVKPKQTGVSIVKIQFFYLCDNPFSGLESEVSL